MDSKAGLMELVKLDGISAGDRRAVRASFDRVKALVNRNPGLRKLDTVLWEGNNFQQDRRGAQADWSS